MRAAWAAICLASASAIAADEAPIDLAGSNPGRVTRFLKPYYPREAIVRDISGVVVVEGIARKDGSIDEVKYLPDKPESEVFIAALKRVVPLWRYSMPIDKDCQPLDQPFRTAVAFQIENDTQKIFLKPEPGAPLPSPTTQTLAARRFPHHNPVERIRPEYPSNMVRWNVMADVYARIVVDRSGTVADVNAKAYTRHNMTAGDVSSFSDSAEKTLRKWRFPEVPPEYKAPWVGCYTINYRISD